MAASLVTIASVGRSDERAREADVTGRLFLIPRRAVNLFERWRWFTFLIGNPLTALGLLLRIRANRDGPHQARYHGHRIFFRARDEQALKEVLVDEEYSFLSDLGSDADSPRILDIGAHIGTFALWCANHVPASQVLCVEANPDTCGILRSNVTLWSRSGMTLRVEHAAAAAMDGESLRLVEPAGASMSARVDEGGPMIAPGLSLPTLVDLCAPEGDDIDLAKIDIEGSEEALICNHPEALRRIRALVVELHPDLCDSTRVEAVLRNEYSDVIDVARRGSSKPLLYCRHHVRRSGARTP